MSRGRPIECEVLVKDVVRSRLSIGTHPVLVGRSAGCGLTLLHPRISWHHALLWVERGDLWIRDLASSHGTRVGRTAAAPMAALPVPPGRRIVLAGAFELRRATHTRSAPTATFVLDDLVVGIAHPLPQGWTMLTAEGPVPGGAPPGPVLEVAEGVRLHDDGVETRIEDGAEFAMPWGRYRLRRTRRASEYRPTIESGGDGAVLSVTLNGPTGPEATVRTREGGTPHRVQGDIRNTLLYLLARKLVRDQEMNVEADQAGWVGHEELASGIWGRVGSEDPSGKLKVVVRRVRQSFASGGFSTALLETRRGAIRLRVAEVFIG